MIVTATLIQYANGNFFMQAPGSGANEIAGSINTFGVFSIPALPNLDYGITILPAPDSAYSRFGANFTSIASGTQDISAILEAAMPPPNPGSSLSLQTNGVENGSQSLLNLVQGTNVVLTDDGEGNVTAAAEISGPVLLSPTENQIIVQPGSTAFEVKAGGTAAELAVAPTQVALIGPTLTLNGTTSIGMNTPSFAGTANIQQYLAPAAGATPGFIGVQANSTDASASVVQFTGGITVFSGISGEAYSPISTTQTINALFGSSIALVDASAGSISVTLPNTLAALGTTTPSDGMLMCFIRNDATPVGHTLTILPESPSTIQGQASLIIPDKSAVTLLATTNPDTGVITWQIQTDNRPPTGVSATITTSALTSGGTEGSMTFVNGILTAQTPAT